jgi:hypothetical protein
MLLFIGPLVFSFTGMIIRCEECDHVLAGDEVEYICKSKSYCEDCCKAVNISGLNSIQMKDKPEDKMAEQLSLLTNAVEALIGIVSECPTCKRRCNEWLQNFRKKG